VLLLGQAKNDPTRLSVLRTDSKDDPTNIKSGGIDPIHNNYFGNRRPTELRLGYGQP
jgi:hypothetical protein